MTDLRKAAEMALEAFSLFDKALQDPHSDDGWKCLHISNGAAQALRQALAQPDEVLAEREVCAKLCEDICLKYSKADDYAERVASQWCAEAIRARSEKRPVKSYCGGKPNYCTPEQGNSSPNYPISESSTPFVDTVNTSQARVEYDRQGNIARLFGPIEPDGTLLYTAPPKREWVGLTEDDVHDAFNYVEMVKLLDFDRDRPEWCEAFASACEARLRHKNGGNK